LTTSPTLGLVPTGSNGPRSWPAIDAGKTDALPADTLDLDNDGETDELLPYDIDGYSRIFGEKVDMGACEHHDRVYIPLVMR
jgi:hypothetical protein